MNETKALKKESLALMMNEAEGTHTRRQQRTLMSFIVGMQPMSSIISTVACAT